MASSGFQGCGVHGEARLRQRLPHLDRAAGAAAAPSYLLDRVSSRRPCAAMRAQIPAHSAAAFGALRWRLGEPSDESPDVLARDSEVLAHVIDRSAAAECVGDCPAQREGCSAISLALAENLGTDVAHYRRRAADRAGDLMRRISLFGHHPYDGFLVFRDEPSAIAECSVSQAAQIFADGLFRSSCGGRDAPDAVSGAQHIDDSGPFLFCGVRFICH